MRVQEGKEEVRGVRGTVEAGKEGGKRILKICFPVLSSSSEAQLFTSIL